jgi:hypothetical protein
MAKRLRRTAPTLPALLPELFTPAAIQHSNRLVQRAEWNDPEGSASTASRTGKRVRGWRAFCPLRRLAERLNGAAAITPEHVTAADLLRQHWDIATLGLSNRAPWVFTDAAHLPRHGPGTLALRQVRAIRSVQRAMALYDAREQAVMFYMVLRNVPLGRAQVACGISQRPVMLRTLVDCLDRLVLHFDDEIRRTGLTA